MDEWLGVLCHDTMETTVGRSIPPSSTLMVRRAQRGGSFEVTGVPYDVMVKNPMCVTMCGRVLVPIRGLCIRLSCFVSRRGPFPGGSRPCYLRDHGPLVDPGWRGPGAGPRRLRKGEGRELTSTWSTPAACQAVLEMERER